MGVSVCRFIWGAPRGLLSRNRGRLDQSLAGLRCIRTYAGLRLFTLDHLPLIGPLARAEGLYVTTGHEGAGICLAPATGLLIAQWLTGQSLDFRPSGSGPVGSPRGWKEQNKAQEAVHGGGCPRGGHSRPTHHRGIPYIPGVTIFDEKRYFEEQGDSPAPQMRLATRRFKCAWLGRRKVVVVDQARLQG